jgi:hypothetical protein
MHSRLFLLFVCLFLAANVANAQSTIFNSPTTDTIAKGDIHFEFDWLAQKPNVRGLDRLHLFTPRVLTGVARNIEVGVSIPVQHRSGSNYSYLEPNVKWRFASNEKKGLAAAAGAILRKPMDDASVFKDTNAVIYGNLSKRFTGAYGPRFTAGTYGVVGAGINWFGPKAGATIGYEQPIHRNVMFAADWVSGKNGLGYLTGGLSFRLPANSVAKAGYSFGNDSYSNNTENQFLFFRYGITF